MTRLASFLYQEIRVCVAGRLYIVFLFLWPDFVDFPQSEKISTYTQKPQIKIIMHKIEQHD